MDWTQTKNVAEANLDAIVGKVSDPKAALTALEKRITGEVAKVEAHLVALDGRVMALPDLLDEADKTVLKVEAIITKAKADGRADLAAAAGARRDKHLAERAALEAELNGIEDKQAEADTWLTRLQDKLLEVQLRRDALPSTPAPAPAPAPAAPAASAAKPAVAPKPAAPAKKGDALDDEFAALLGELDVDLSKVELPKKKKPLPVLPDSDDAIPDLVTVADDELPEGEELPPLEKPKGKAAAPAAKAAAPAAKAATPAPKAAAPAAKAAAPTVAKAATPAASEAPKKKSKAWLWITTGVVVVGGGGAALAHFVFHLF